MTSQSMKDVESDNDIGIVTLRWSLLIAITLILLFVPGDLLLFPEIGKHAYFVRTALQVSAVFLYLLYSFHSSFIKYRQIVLLILVTSITYINYYLIYYFWVKFNATFPYEGVVLYSFFSIFVLRLTFKFSLSFVSLSIVGFGVLVFNHPMYGIYTMSNFGFVAGSQIVSLYGSYHLWRSFRNSHKLTEHLKMLSRTDQLSGLLNRRAYEEESKKLLSISARSNVSFTVFLLDIDDFKRYNDTYGHIKGDEVIQIQSEILLDIFKRQSDIIGRYGGEEFIVFASNMDMDKLLEMGQNLIDSWSTRKIEHKHASSEGHITSSLGIYTAIPTQDSDIHSFILKADEALYVAKKSGRNCVKIVEG